MRKKNSGAVRYAAYSRCSTDDQAKGDFTTIDVQDSLNRHYIAEKGGECAGAYRDEGKSGTNLNRNGWRQLLVDAQAGKFDIVVVTYMSRLGRGNAFINAEYELGKYDVKVEMVKEKFADDIGGYMGKNMTNVMDGMYAYQIRGWTMTKMEAMVAAGYCTGGYPPFGFLKVIAVEATGFHKAGKEPPKRLVPHPDDAPIVRRAYELFIESASQTIVRDYLNSVTPRKWTHTTVRSLLTGEVYKGVLQFGQWRNETAWEAIIEPSVWQAAQETFIKSGMRPGCDRAVDEYTYYLRGHVVCPHCGCPCTQASHHGHTKRVHYYVCQKANRREKCPVVRVNADRVHHTVLHFIRHAQAHETVMHRLIAQSGGWSSADEAQKALRGQLGKQKQALEMRIANYVKAIGDGRDSPAVTAALAKVEAESEAVTRQMEQVDQEIRRATIKRPTAAQVQEAWGRVLEVWAVLSEEERCDLLGSLVKTVEITEKESITIELLPMPIGYSPQFALDSHLGAAGEVIAINPPLLTTHTFPPVELDYDIIRPKRVVRRATAEFYEKA